MIGFPFQHRQARFGDPNQTVRVPTSVLGHGFEALDDGFGFAPIRRTGHFSTRFAQHRQARRERFAGIIAALRGIDVEHTPRALDPFGTTFRDHLAVEDRAVVPDGGRLCRYEDPFALSPAQHAQGFSVDATQERQVPDAVGLFRDPHGRQFGHVGPVNGHGLRTGKRGHLNQTLEFRGAFLGHVVADDVTLAVSDGRFLHGSSRGSVYENPKKL